MQVAQLAEVWQKGVAEGVGQGEPVAAHLPLLAAGLHHGGKLIRLGITNDMMALKSNL